MTWLIEYYSGSWQTLTGAYLDEVSEKLANFEYFKFSIGNNSGNRTIVKSKPEVRIKWSGNVIYTGKLLKWKFTNGLIECWAFPEPYDLMRKKVFSSVHNASYADDVLDTICAAASVVADFDATGWGATPVVSVRFSNAKPFDAARYLAKACNGVYWMDNTTFYIAKTRGTDKGVLPTISGGDNTQDTTAYRDRIIYIGVDANGSEIQGSYGAGDDVEVFRTKKASDIATLNSLAQAKYEELNTETLSTDFAISISDGYNLYPGDTIDIVSSTYDYSASDLLIVKTLKKLGEISVSVEKSAVTLDDLFEFTKNLEDLGIYVGGTAQIPLWQQKWTSDIEFSASSHTTAAWTSGDITFADGTVKSINAGSRTVASDDSYEFIYYTIDDNTLNNSTSHSAAIASGNILLAQLYRSSNSEELVQILTDVSVIGNAPLVSNIAKRAIEPYMQITPIQPYTVDCEIEHVVGSEDTAVVVQDGTIEFADGTTHSITSSPSHTGLSPSTFYYIYFLLSDNVSHISDDYGDVVGNDRGQIATIRTPAAAGANENQQQIAIIPYRGKTLQINADYMNAYVIRSIHMSTESFYGKDIGTQAGVGQWNGGVRIVGSGSIINTGASALQAGIHGYSAGGLANQTFFLDNATGYINVNGTGAFITNAWDASSADWYEVGYVEGTTQGYDGTTYDLFRFRSDVDVASPNSKGAVSISANGDTVNFYEGDDIVVNSNFVSLVPSSDKGVRIGDGTTDFLIHIPNYSSDFTGTPPTSDEQYQIRMLRTAGNDAEVYIGMQMSDDSWSWETIATGSAAAALADLTDVTITGPSANDLLQYNGTKWVDRSYSEANVVATTDTDVSGNSWVIDEDNMSSNLDTKVPTQQSVKAYVDNAAPTAHHATHENGGSDEISVAGLSGVLSDAQTPIAHALNSAYHTGDLAYSQLDAIVDTSGGGASNLLSRADHVHSGADGSSQITISSISDLTFGIADGNALEVDGSPSNGELAIFTADGLDGTTLSGDSVIGYDSGTISYNGSNVLINSDMNSDDSIIYYNDGLNAYRQITMGNLDLSQMDNTNSNFAVGDDYVAIAGDTMTGTLNMNNVGIMFQDGVTPDDYMDIIASTNNYIRLYNNKTLIIQDQDSLNTIAQFQCYNNGVTALSSTFYHVTTAGTSSLAFETYTNGIGIGGTNERIVENGDDMEFYAAGDFVFDGDVTADLYHGDFYWGDLKFTDLYCPECGERFKVGDTVDWLIIAEGVREKVGEHFSAIPKHKHCNPWIKLKYKINKLLRDN